jgi:hypothetical protein
MVTGAFAAWLPLGCSPEQTSQAPPPTREAAPPPSADGSPGNHPPAIRAAAIYPSDLTRETILRVEVTGEDMDGDRLEYRYKWLVNGLSVPSATDAHFSPEQLRRGDQISAELTPNDGKVDGHVFNTSPVTVGNTAPSIDEIHMEPVPLYRGQPLKVRVVARDPDEDPIQLSYNWFRNGKELPAAQTASLDTKEFRKKDALRVQVTPSDGKAAREPVAGVLVMIENAPPRITSVPPTILSDGEYIYQVTATDADEDRITYELKQGAPGMTIDATTAKLTWKLTPESTGKHTVIIIAKDSDNASTQQDFEIEGLRPKAQPTAP